MVKYLFGLLVIIGLGSCKDLSEVKATGLVRDAATQMPLDSVTVSLYEDNDGAFMGKHLLQETTTDASGTFRFDFEYKEGPYLVFVNRPGYRYSRAATDKIFGLTTYLEYQNIEPLENEQYMVFDMAPQTFLTIKVKNTPPALPTDQLIVEVGRGREGGYGFNRTFDGLVDLDFAVGNVDGNTYVPLRYTIRENNVSRTVVDSIAVQPVKAVTYLLNY